MAMRIVLIYIEYKQVTWDHDSQYILYIFSMRATGNGLGKKLGTRQDVVGKPTGRSFRNKRKNINLENCEDKNKNTEDTLEKGSV